MFCHKCGNKSPEGAEFCNKCGEKLINNTTISSVSEDSKLVSTMPTATQTTLTLVPHHPPIIPPQEFESLANVLFTTQGCVLLMLVLLSLSMIFGLTKSNL